MKNIKKQLMGAVAMLVVAAVMLTSVSYAWFTLSTNPEVTNIEASVAANQNLEIALDNGYANEDAVDGASGVNADGTGPQGSQTGNPYTWGNLVDLSYAFGNELADTNHVSGNKIQLAPVKAVSDNATGDIKLHYPEYGKDGRVANTNKVLSANTIKDMASVSPLKGGVIAYSKEGENNVYDAFGVTYWLRSNQDAQISLVSGNGVKRADDANTQSGVNGVSGNASFIQFPVAEPNTVARIDSYMKKLVIQMDVYKANGSTMVKDETIYAVPSVSSNNPTNTLKYELKLSDKKASVTGGVDKTIAVSANVAKKIVTTVYLDGETVTNADALLGDLTGMKLNIQFQSNAIEANNTSKAMTGATATN